ncbi:MAG TPA: hypothetical protein VF691_04420 [Cytophagaceae bacterium]|jgi:hypothetical protein
MKDNLVRCLIAVVNTLFLFIGSSCDRKTENGTKDIRVIIETDSITSQMRAGVGVNFANLQDSFPVVQLERQYRSYAGSTWGANPALDDSASWKKVFGYADWLGIDLARVFVTRNIFEPQKGKLDFDNVEMRYLYKYLDYCQKNDIDVFLQNFFNNVAWLAVPSAGNDPIKILRSAPNDLEAYTEGLVTLLNHLIKEKKYTCIKYFCLTNEPYENWSWYIGSFNPDRFASPEPAYKMMHEKLIKNKLPVMLSGPDVSIFLSSKINPSMPVFDYFKSFDIHSYVTRFDWWADSTMTFEDGSKGEVNKIEDTEKQYSSWVQRAKKENKPFIVSEMGSFMYGFGEDTNGMSTYPALLKDVESVLRYSNIGMDGFMRWSYLNRGNLDGQWQLVNTWDMKKNALLPADGIAPHKVPFYMWGMLSRFIPKHANILKSTVEGGKIGQHQRVFATTYQSPANKNLSIFIINDSEIEMEVSLEFKKKLNNKTLYKYSLNRDLIDQPDFNLNPSDLMDFDGSNSKVKLLPQSLVLLSTYKLNSDQKGIIVD